MWVIKVHIVASQENTVLSIKHNKFVLQFWGPTSRHQLIEWKGGPLLGINL